MRISDWSSDVCSSDLAGAVHRHVGALVDMAQRNAVLDQRLFKRKRTADQEGDEIVAPDLFQVRHLGDWLAVLPDAVERDVGADVDILAQGRQERLARLAGRQQRTGLRVAQLGQPEWRERGVPYV